MEQRGYRTGEKRLEAISLQDLPVARCGALIAGKVIQAITGRLPDNIDHPFDIFRIDLNCGSEVQGGVIGLTAVHLIRDGRHGVEQQKGIYLPLDLLALIGFVPPDNLYQQGTIKKELLRKGIVMEQFFRLPAPNQIFCPWIVRKRGGLQIQREEKRRGQAQ